MYCFGLVQLVAVPSSSWHSKVLPALSALKPNEALVFLVAALGPLLIAATGATVSTVMVSGSEGWLTVISPYVVTRNLLPSRILLQRPGAPRPEQILITPDRSLYAYEADAFAEAVWAGEREVAAMTLDDTLGNMATLDRWLASAAGKAVD